LGLVLWAVWEGIVYDWGIEGLFGYVTRHGEKLAVRARLVPFGDVLFWIHIQYPGQSLVAQRFERLELEVVSSHITRFINPADRGLSFYVLTALYFYSLPKSLPSMSIPVSQSCLA